MIERKDAIPISIFEKCQKFGLIPEKAPFFRMSLWLSVSISNLRWLEIICIQCKRFVHIDARDVSGIAKFGLKAGSGSG